MGKFINRSFAFTFIFCLSVAGSLAAQDAQSLIKNGSLEWDGDQLKHWEIAEGAGRGARASLIRKTDDGSLEFSGDSRTQLWNFVGQSFPVKPGDCLQLSYTAKATDVRQERGQNNNCYAAIFFKKDGRVVGNTYFTVTESEYTAHERIVNIPDGVDEAQATLFLSKTGTLNFKSVDVRPLAEKDSFDVLVRQMDRYYSYFDHKNIDWKELTDKYRENATEAANVEEFQSVVMKMLAELKDGHVWIMDGQNRLPSWRAEKTKYNFNFGVVEKQLSNINKIKRQRRIGLIAKTADNFGYIRITSLQAKPEDMQLMIDAIDRSLRETDGMIIDLRANGGGSEDLGKMLAGLFCQEDATYAINRFRKNEKHDEFVEFTRSPVQPRDGKIYDKPVVCLIGPGAVSSAEGTALMFQALPNVTLIGQPTRGSTGNPAPVNLPNGLEIWFSRWVACDASGEPIEDRGVQPDIVVERGDGDPAWERAIQSLQEQKK